MIRRLFAILVLLAVAAAFVYVWKLRPAGLSLPSLGPVGRGLADGKTTAEVKTAFGLDRGLKELAVSVSTENGVVTLRGEVPGEEARRAAEETASSVPGVRQVVNQLAVVPAASTAPGESRSMGEALDDRAVEVSVRLALSLRRELSGADVTVTAFRKQVTLAGTVPSAAARRVAVRAAGRTNGVASVKDELRVATTAQDEGAGPQGESARQAAERAVRDNTYLAPYDLRVTLDEGGKLVLRGRVRSGAERDLAAVLAQNAAGGPVEIALQTRP